jgi:hypothetical protein
LKFSATFPAIAVQSKGSRTAKSPHFKAVSALSKALE